MQTAQAKQSRIDELCNQLESSDYEALQEMLTVHASTIVSEPNGNRALICSVKVLWVRLATNEFEAFFTKLRNELSHDLQDDAYAIKIISRWKDRMSATLEVMAPKEAKRATNY